MNMNTMIRSALTPSGNSNRSQSHQSSDTPSKESDKGNTLSPLPNTKFLNLFEGQKWRAIRSRLRSSKAKQLVKATGCFGISSLALALGHNAPLDIVKQIMDITPTLAEQKDVLGASPLHIACLNGAPLQSIQLLVQRYPNLVSDRDADLRTPLHHAVEFICRMDNSVSREDREERFLVVKDLIAAAPETIHWTDKHDDSPLDLAHIIMLETDNSSFSEDEITYNRVEKLYRYLKKQSIKAYLRKKKEWEHKGFNTSVFKTETTSKTHKSEGTAETEDTSCGNKSR